MVHDVSLYDFELPEVDDWIAGDDRVLAYTVTDADGNGVDISSATITWGLFDRAYETDSADAVLDETDGDVTIDTSGDVDPTAGEFEVVVDGSATADEWGEYYQRPSVESSAGEVSSWRGEVTLEA